MQVFLPTAAAAVNLCPWKIFQKAIQTFAPFWKKFLAFGSGKQV